MVDSKVKKLSSLLSEQKRLISLINKQISSNTSNIKGLSAKISKNQKLLKLNNKKIKKFLKG